MLFFRRIRRKTSAVFLETFLYLNILGSLKLSASFSQNVPKYANERRCLLTPARSQEDSMAPLILIGGTAQTISSWEHQLGFLSANRDVLVYECLGQGPYPQFMKDSANPSLDSLEKYFENVSLERQANDLKSVISKVFPDASSVDVAGFSFGGRVAMATASSHPNLIRKLHLTGVAAERTPYARLILKSWVDILRSARQAQFNLNHKETSTNLILPFAWSSIMSTYSPAFLGQNEKRIPKWVQFVSEQNTIQGILALLEQTHTENKDDPWHPVSMANKIVSNNCVQEVKLCVGSLDCMATVEEAKKLGQIMKCSKSHVQVHEGCGHAVMIEDSRRWRNELIQFLDA